MPVIDVVRMQEEACARAGSALYARILHAVAEDVEASGTCAGLLAPWAANALADAIPLRLLAAVHRIVLRGDAPELARFYPSAGGVDDGDPVPAFLAVVEEHAGELEEGMRLGVQTNEVGRACSLMGGFHEVARRFGLPLRILEVGASAGLLLRWDHYRYSAGEETWGQDLGLVFDQPWTDGHPRFVDDLTVVERRGCDIRPIDPSSDDGAIALRGFLWPDQIHRRIRLDAALSVARKVPVTVDATDAGAWVQDRLADAVPGVATVVYHSIVLQYLPRSSFRRMRNALESAGRRAAPESPLAWLRMEPAGVVADVRLRTWPDDTDRVLGTTDYHGPPVHWGAPAS